MNQTSWRKNVLLIPIVVAILTSTAWSVSHFIKKSPRTPVATTTAKPAEDFFQDLYQKRLREEGDRKSRVEQMIKDGRLSGTRARYYKTAGEKAK